MIRVTEVHEVHEVNGDKFIVFNGGDVMALRADGAKEFTNTHGRNLHLSPNSRYYPALVKMWQAYKAA